MSAFALVVDAHNVLDDPRGIGVYVRALLARFARQDDVELTLLMREMFPPRKRAQIARAIGSEHFHVAGRVPRNARVVWHPWNGTFFNAGCVPSVATIHDVAPFAFPPRDARASKRQQAPFVRAARAARVITDSAFSRGEIERYLQVESKRIAVIPLSADPRFAPGDPTLLPEALRDRSYVLAVGANDPRKNLETLARAHREVFPTNEVALVCVTHDAPDGTLELSNVTFEMLRDLYRGALAFAMPSHYEGFGIPPLEAMRCGTPVVSARSSSLPEVCGDAALYVDDYNNVAAWAGALRRITEDGALRVDLRARGIEHATRFSWKRTAEETLAILKAVGA